MRCPYCLKETHTEVTDPAKGNQAGSSSFICSNCKAELHYDYVKETHVPKVITGLVGFSGHGKTVYITALFYMLELMQSVWQNYYYSPLDDHTIKSFYDRIKLFKLGVMPASTPENFPRPSLFKFRHLPYFNNWFISFYDIAGAIFEDSKKIKEKGDLLANADVAIFILSIPDSGENWVFEIERLLDIYLQGVHNFLQVDLRSRQHLIVVLSKADELIDKIPKEFQDYLTDGDYQWFSGDIDMRMRTLRRKSKEVQEWLRENRCGGFVNKARDNFKSAEYTLVSSLGMHPDKRPGEFDSKRVLDPFLWIMEKTNRKGLFGRLRESLLL